MISNSLKYMEMKRTPLVFPLLCSTSYETRGYATRSDLMRAWIGRYYSDIELPWYWQIRGFLETEGVKKLPWSSMNTAIWLQSYPVFLALRKTGLLSILFLTVIFNEEWGQCLYYVKNYLISSSTWHWDRFD